MIYLQLPSVFLHLLENAGNTEWILVLVKLPRGCLLPGGLDLQQNMNGQDEYV